MKLMTIPSLAIVGLSMSLLAGCSGAAPEPVDQAPRAALANTAAAPSAGTANAAGPDGRSWGHGRMHDKAGFKKLDANGDGRIELSELPERARERLASADTNHDGVLSKEEMMAHAKAKHEERFQRMDKNHDGALTADEVGERRWNRIKAADADGNGSVTQDELKQAFESGVLKFKHRGHRGEGRPDPGAAPSDPGAAPVNPGASTGS